MAATAEILKEQFDKTRFYSIVNGKKVYWKTWEFKDGCLKEGEEKDKEIGDN